MPTDTKHMIQQCAHNGTLVYYMDQSDTAPLAEPGPWGAIQDGYCAGLTVRWIRLTYAGRDFVSGNSNWGGVAMQYFNGTDWQATVYQNKLNTYVGATDTTRPVRTQYALGLAQMMLGDIQEGSESAPANGARLTRVISKSYGNYYTSLGGPDGNHAIAFRHARPASGKGPGEFHIFDPNYGHFMWNAPASAWPTIIDWYLLTTDYKKDFPSAYFITRATPPVNY